MLAVSTAPVRRGLIATALALLMLLALPAQAMAAADTFRFQGESAFATWLLDDDLHTAVTVGAFDGKFHAQSGPPEDVQEVFVGVFQRFCDEDADELVFRNFIGFADAEVDIDHARLTEADVDGALTMDGFETRDEGCDSPPDFPPFPGNEHIGEFDVEVTTSWEGVGELTRSRSSFHFDEPGFKVRSQSMQRSRDAEANGMLSGLDDVGVPSRLGEADFAEITSFKDSSVFIDQPE